MDMKAVSFNLHGEASLDSKGRIKLPAIFIEELNRVYEDNCTLIATSVDKEKQEMRVFPLDEWNRMIERIDRITQNNPTSPEGQLAAAFRYTATMNAKECKVDNQQRIVLPKCLREKLNIEGKVKLLGMGTEFRIISEEAARIKEEEFLKKFDFSNISF